MNIYVGNLSFAATDEELRTLFSSFGEVKTVKIMRDLHTGQSRGFGFVEIESRKNGDAAVAQLNGSVFMGRALRVIEAKAKIKTPPPANMYPGHYSGNRNY